MATDKHDTCVLGSRGSLSFGGNIYRNMAASSLYLVESQHWLTCSLCRLYTGMNRCPYLSVRSPERFIYLHDLVPAQASSDSGDHPSLPSRLV